jgi:hypothetical protein
MKRSLTILRDFLHDVATLKRPVTATAFVALVVSLLSPVGINVGPAGAYLLGAVVLAGTIAAYVESLLNRKPARKSAPKPVRKAPAKPR